MPDDPTQPKPDDAPRPAGVPKPPSEADITEVSKDQALITDEWAAPTPETQSGEGEGRPG